MLKIFLSIFVLMIIFSSTADAKSIRTPEGNFPRVQWAVVESTPGNLEKISEIGSRVLAKTSAAESGTYALYGVVEKNNPDLMRLLEIYESDEAYRIHSTSENFQKYRAERFQFLKNLRLLPVNGIVLEQKDGEVGKFVVTTKFEVKAENLIEFQNLMSEEYFRAVEKNSDVVGMFLTAEKENPNIFHTMNIFKDENSYKNYLNSAENKNLREKIKNMILSEKNIEYLPTKISMTGKGARK